MKNKILELNVLILSFTIGFIIGNFLNFLFK